ncbi:MAG: serine protease [Myxococcales bacterium]|nr:MAG: serine protease [Myxococcales bacterium]
MRARIRAAAACLLVWASGIAYAQEIDYAALYKKTAPAVVYVAAFIDETPARSGAGFVVAADGLVLTSRHVVWDEARDRPAGRVLVFLKPERVTGRSQDDLVRRYDAVIFKEDKNQDLALLKLRDAPANLATLAFAPEGSGQVGAPTAAIGHPVGGSRWSLTTGRISGEIADLEGVRGRGAWQMETAINPGNSGGPLLDKDGGVLGVNSVIVRKAPDGTVVEGVAFAVRSEAATAWLKAAQAAFVTASAAPAAAAPTTPVAATPVKAGPAKPGTVFAPSQLEKTKRELEGLEEEMRDEVRRRNP